MTNYVILRKRLGEHPDDWEQLTAMYAPSAEAAIRAIIEESGEGVYVAVPARSWKQHTVKVETKQAIRFS